MIPFQQYPDKYPDLISQLLIFFGKHKNGIHEQATIMEFCSFYNEKYQPIEFPQPTYISKICSILADNNILSVIRKGYGDAGEDMYWYRNIRTIERLSDLTFKYAINIQCLSLVFGFTFINKYASNKVQPLLHVNNYNDHAIGTTFNFKHGIATAKHCIEGAKTIGIKNFSKESLLNSRFLIHKNKEIDVLFIELKNKTFLLDKTFFLTSEGEILDNILALGFPKIPGFHSFLTSETAKISSRYTATSGNVAAIAEDIWMKENLILITAKIRAGNSGGPILNDRGEVVGISSNVPISEGNYDDLGYGTVIPISFLDEIIDGENFVEFDTSKIEFIDFPN